MIKQAVKERPMIFSDTSIRAIQADRKTMTRRVVTNPKASLVDVQEAEWVEKYANALGFTGCWSFYREIDKTSRHRGKFFACNRIAIDTLHCPYGRPGDRLWCKEAAYIAPPNFGDPADAMHTDSEGRPRVVGYAASMGSDTVRCAMDYGVRKTSPIFLPRWAARLILEITDIRVERLQSISEEDIEAEGITRFEKTTGQAVYSWYGITRFETAQSPRQAFRNLWDQLNGKRLGCSWADNPWVWSLLFKRIKI